jgi:hypothetical protein
MKTLRTLSEIGDLARNRTDVYVRWSRGPELDIKQGASRDYADGYMVHGGLSCQRVYADDWKMPLMLIEYRFLRRKDSQIYGWIFSGERNGTDSDGAPTVDASTITPIGRISEQLVDALDEYNTAYWAWDRKGFKGDRPELPK